MSWSRLIDIAINAPVTIALGLLIPYIQKWISQLFQAHSATRLAKIRENYVEALMLQANPHEFTDRLIMHSLFAALGVAGIGIGILVSGEGYLSYLIRLYGSSSQGDRFAGIMGWANEIVGALVTFSSSILFSAVVRDIMGLYERVKLFAEYETTVPIEVRRNVRDEIAHLAGIDTQASKPESTSSGE